MAQPVQYQPAVIAEFASKLYSEASSLVIKWALMLGVVGAVIGGFVSAGKGGGGMVPLIAGLVGALFGASYGREKGFTLRLQAQQALCQLQIEQNTRPKV